MVTQVAAQPPLGVRLNNPGNLRAGIAWEGLTYPPAVNGFCSFSTPAFGFRAIFRNYITKYDRGIRTIRALITEWAPPSENNTAAYIAAVCQRTGFDPDAPIELKSWAIAKAVCKAQTIQECGAFDPYFTDAQMAEGAFRAGIADAPAPIAHKVAVTVSAAAATVAAAAGPIAGAIQTAQPNLPTTHNIQMWCAIAAAVLGVIAIFYNIRKKSA